jgi:serine/threonine protein kinase
MHRDIKPGNILLRRDNGKLVPKLGTLHPFVGKDSIFLSADFGLARIVEESGASTMHVGRLRPPDSDNALSNSNLFFRNGVLHGT